MIFINNSNNDPQVIIKYSGNTTEKHIIVYDNAVKELETKECQFMEFEGNKIKCKIGRGNFAYYNINVQMIK